MRVQEQDRWSRPMRISHITERLLSRPYRVFSLGDLAREMNVARSTVSEDVSIIREVFRRTGVGAVETLSGATGGVRLKLIPSPEQRCAVTEQLIQELKDPRRILPGGFLYMTDIIFSPRWGEILGAYFSHIFAPYDPDYVVTIETKGIPLALMTARALNRPLVLIRRNSRVTEGSSVNINYVSGSSSRIQTMSLPRRAIESGKSAVVVDDFMRGGGTARGACDLLDEFDVRVMGIGVVAVTDVPEQKRVPDYASLVQVSFDSGEGHVDVRSTAPQVT